MIKILSIGNSFSTDAHRYISRIAKASEAPIKTVNLYIGACSLRMHYFNILEDAKSYQFEFNGENTGLKVSIKDALMSDCWDYVTIQQASLETRCWESFAPYLSEITACVKKYAPQAKLLVHQTWAFDAANVERLERGGFESANHMYECLRENYKKMAQEINADGIIPAGYAIHKALQNGLTNVYRDGFHLSQGNGRLLVALLWFCYFTGKSATTIPCPHTDRPVSEEDYGIIQKTITTVLK